MAVLDVKTKGGYRKKGVATNWILRMTQDAESGKLKNPRVACFLRKSGDFSCPKTVDKASVVRTARAPAPAALGPSSLCCLRPHISHLLS